MAPKFGRSRVSVMYRFLIVVCSLDLKWGRESCLRRDSHGCRGDFIFFHKNVSYGVHYYCKKNCETTLCGRTGIYRRDKLLCFKFANRFEIYRLIQVVSPSKTSIVPSGTICFPESEF